MVLVSSSLRDVSLIVCSRNRPDLLAGVVRDILAGHELPAELIIVDQSDRWNEDLAALAFERDCAIVYEWMNARGLSRALNRGLALASHDIIAFTHDDVAIPPEWFGTLVRALVAAGGRAVVTGRVLPEKGVEDSGFVPSTKSDETPAVYSGRVDAGVLYPMNMAMRRAAITAAGPFDERLGPGTPFPAAEDNDLAFRLLEAGYSIHYEPAAALVHRAWRSDRDYLPLRWSYGRGQGAFYAKHLDLRDRYLLGRLLWEAQFRLRRSVRRLMKEPRRSLGDVVYLSGLASGVAAWSWRRFFSRDS